MHRRRSVVAGVLIGSIASLPMLMPAGLAPGPGNTGLPDLLLVGLVVTTLLWAGTRRTAVHWPFLVPTLLTIIAGGIAAILNNAGALTLVKDIFVLLWAVSIANLGRDVRLLRTAFRAWVYIGTCYAVVMIVGFVAGIDALSGKQIDGERAMFTFGDANYASNWFICVFFLARATRVPARPGARWAVCGILLVAEILTGSNGGALALGVALVAGHLFRLFREGRAHQAIATASLAAFVGGGALFALSQIDIQPYLDQASAASPVLRDSIGRTTGESTGSRSTVFESCVRMLRDQTHPFGIGPGQTENQMRVRQEAYVREAHNDYVAAVLERGVLGGFALVVLIFVLLLKCARVARRGALKPEYAAVVPRPELLGALVIVFLVSALFYETLHYRHGWAFFGLIAALDIFGRRRPETVQSPFVPPPRRPRRSAKAPAPAVLTKQPTAMTPTAGKPTVKEPPAKKPVVEKPVVEERSLRQRIAGRGISKDRVLGLVAGNMAGRVGALASLGIATILVARVGGPALVGAFTLVRILPGLVCHLSNAGLPGAAPYFLSGKEYDQARVRPTLAWLTVIGAALGGLSWLVLSPLLFLLFFKTFGLWVAVVAAVPAFTQGFVSVGKGLLQGTDDLRGASLAITVEEFVFLPIYLVILLGWYGPGALITGLVLADLAAAAWIARRLVKRGFFSGWGRFDRALARKISGYGMRGQLGQLIDLLNLRLDVAFLGAMAGPAVLGVYTVASKFAELVQLPGLAVNYVLYPDFAKTDKATATARTRRLILPALAVSALSALPLALIAGTLLPVVFSDAFNGAVTPTYILLFGLTTFGVSGLVMAYLYGVGRPGLTSLAQAAGLAVTVVLDLALIPHFGAVGAAIASAISYYTTTAVLLFWFARLKGSK